MECCILQWLWFVMSVGFVLVGVSHKIYEYLPTIIRDAVVYGKLLDKKKRTAIQETLLVPKRWFLHFYGLSFCWNGWLLTFVVKHVTEGSPLPEWLASLLGFLTTYPVSPASADLLSVVIVMTVIVIHAWRRVYECLFLSVYSKSSIHFLHYLIGIFFYSFIGLSVLAEGPDLTETGSPMTLLDLLWGIRWYHGLGVLLFFWASWHHHMAHAIFANLRTKKEDVNRHLIPSGDWFNYVSCPHYLAEILIYVSLAVILGGHHSTYWLVLVFVVSNQTVASLEVHRWYRTKFEDYPKDRRAFIPFIL